MKGQLPPCLPDETTLTDETVIEGRQLLVEYLRRELVGPVGGEKEELDGEPPHKRYTMGVLFPQDASSASQDEEEEESEDNSSDLLTDDPVTLAGQYMPSSMGVSFFFVGEPKVDVYLYAARYIKEKGSRAGAWQRTPLATEKEPEVVRLQCDSQKGGRTTHKVLANSAELCAHWRALSTGFLVTITLVNTASSAKAEVRGEDCLCQAGFTCSLPFAEIQEYPSVNLLTTEDEEQELQLLYRRNKVYAIGHGCSTEWEIKSSAPQYIKTQVMPTADVAAMTHDLKENPYILTVARLADTSIPKSVIIGELEAFTELYAGWIDELDSNHKDVTERLAPAKGRIVSRLAAALGRMRSGVQYLATDATAWQAFQLANLAMLMQMRHGGKDLAGTRYERNKANTSAQDYYTLSYKWRPFQLAFQLLTVESIGNEASSSRDTVDLIWFPTGGGKTEAYLAVAAFEIFRRRIIHKDKGAGTAVITRYTLRLLTSQQFQRAVRLMCACELLRRQDPETLGTIPITIGFWAGRAASPNKYQQACEKMTDLLEEDFPANKNPFQIESCPWCGTELLPGRRVEDSGDYGFKCDNTSFKAFCPTDSCAFHDSIPASVVDEDLYDNPPSFLIGTVDKFAQLAWVAGGGAFFGGSQYLPPTLVIQDELHLLSGPLGTTVGLYESAIEALMSFHGAKPKIIASTATIRSAGEQVKGLFGRNVALFPPSGLTADDSFFAKTDTSTKGRLYVGIMSANHRSATSSVRTAAALQQAIEEEDLTDAEKDAYWTLVIYHLSLRELGKTVSFARDDIPARIKIISSTAGKARDILDDQVLELTSNLNAGEIPASLARMDNRYDADGAVSILACTNMFSVGVDVPRLGLMMMSGQPKTTSEYIQASSRVGRGKIPGLVVTHYAASKPRDRSHYEAFLPYHASIYRFVEPTSVTPFSLPARNRALHAALVILIRHGVGLSGNDAAKRFDKHNPEVVRAVSILAAQAAIKDPEEASGTVKHLQRLVDEWHDLAQRAAIEHYPLVYKGERPTIMLLKDFGEPGEGWPTLNSMRNVDAECGISVIGQSRY
jgi:hypothetical protein